MWVSTQKYWYPKMDGENHGKPYEQMDDLGWFPPIFGNIHVIIPLGGNKKQKKTP